MNIYLAARYSRRAEMCSHAAQLRALGLVVTSRWINGGHEIAQDDQENARFAIEDYEDVAKADLLIFFAEPKRTESRGGRHVEFGFAVALGKKVLVVGPHENVFHWLPGVIQVDTWPAALELLGSYVPPPQSAMRPIPEEWRPMRRLVGGHIIRNHGTNMWMAVSDKGDLISIAPSQGAWIPLEGEWILHEPQPQSAT